MYNNIKEEELKNKVGQDYFHNFDTTMIVGNIDFCVVPKSKNIKSSDDFNSSDDSSHELHSLLWAEAKTGDYDIVAMFAQLILTIGKARTFDKSLPPAFLGAFDYKKIAFVPYDKVQHIFYKNDFNWNVTPSNQESKEFLEIRSLIESILKSSTYIYNFGKDDKELAHFIKNNIAHSSEGGKIRIDKNNFVPIYLRWLENVKPLINFDFSEGKKQNILDSDFYLADLFVDDHDTTNIDDDTPLKDNIFVVFRGGHYEIAKENLRSLFNATIDIKDKNNYEQFWKKYKRPPVVEYQNYIIERRDLLVPQDIRERKGAFFTPRQWVELSQQYITDVLGENWQEEYYVWDCAAGTGNLLTGLTNKYHIWASTLDQADVNAMHDRIKNGANLLDSHVFQFDFLNDDFSKLPAPLFEIINDPEKRKKLLIYINPPYAEITNAKTQRGTGENRTGLTNNKTKEKYSNVFGSSINEVFAQFLIRIYCEIPNSKIANFSKLKNLQSSNFSDFRKTFRAKLEKIFLVPADTFDNVKGQFPIGFFVWNSEIKELFEQIEAKVYDKNGCFLENKKIYSYSNSRYVIEWLRNYYDKSGVRVGYLRMLGTDMQHNKDIFISNDLSPNDFKKHLFTIISQKNIIEMSIYNTIRHCIEATWLNDRDQFLYPNEGWETDTEFQNDCLTYTLFSNNIQSKYGTNHWIPFTEEEVDAGEKFESSFMTDFIKGKLKQEKTNTPDLFAEVFTDTMTLSHRISKDINKSNNLPLEFSPEAKEVFDAGKQLWKYYHKKIAATDAMTSSHRIIEGNVNASLYDIREYFQGRNEKGKMNNKSDDAKYMNLIGNLREKLKLLAKKIEPKVYEYGFLK